MPRKNSFLLALAIVYGILAIIQANMNGLFETKFYHSIVFISFIVTGCEAVKGRIDEIIRCKVRFKSYTESETMLAKQHIDIYNRYPFLNDDINSFKMIIDRNEKNQQSKSQKGWYYFYYIVSFIEVLSLVVIILFIPVLNIPDTLNNDRVISVISLLTLAFSFYSIYINDYIAEELKESKEKIEYETKHSNYYLDIIKKISVYQKHNNFNDDNESNKEK